MTFRTRPAVALPAIAVLAGLLAWNGFAGSGAPPARSAAVADIHVDPYPLADDLDSVVSFRHADIVVATIESVGAARWNTPDHAKPAGFDVRQRTAAPLYQISSPVSVRVDAVLHGRMRPGQRMTVRSLGGERDGVRLTFGHTAPTSLYRPGSTFVFFLTAPVDAGDGLVASTPNFVFTVDGDTTAPWDGGYTVPLPTLAMRVAAARVG